MSNKKMTRALKPDELERIAGRFKMLGEPMRLKILQAVCKSPRMVSDIVAATGSTQANISKHLALLAVAGILQRAKNGQCVYYSVKDQLAVKMCELVRTQIAHRP
jgi:DNA-binding transcriptional ArsR family regulator